MSRPLNEGHHRLIKWLAEMVAEEMLKTPNSHLATEAPPFSEELHDHPKPIVQHPDGSISVLIM